MLENFFKMEARSIIPGLWGDYGDILQHGMTAHSPRINGRLALERTGPYIPTVTLPGFSIVLTSEARELLESSGLTGFSFLPVEKRLIVELHWESWDLSAREPAEYPNSGEPEDYILARPHSPTAAVALGDLWEVIVTFNVEVLRPTSTANSYRDLQIDLRSWNGADFLRSREYGGCLFSQRAHDWISEHWEKYVEFHPFPAA
jgi:hypothetical protein